VTGGAESRPRDPRSGPIGFPQPQPGGCRADAATIEPAVPRRRPHHCQPRSPGGNGCLFENLRRCWQCGHRCVQRAAGLSARSGGHPRWQ